MAILKDKQPSKVIILGGDCVVSQAPFACLNEKYNGTLGVLWLDAHPVILQQLMKQQEFMKWHWVV